MVDNISLCPLMAGGVITSYSPDILSTTDYYAGGQEMPGRKWTGGDEYRYSHNGHERQDEVYEGAQSAEYWMYDSRILRRWEMDPVVKEWESPYAAFGNNPIYFADPLGLDGDDKGNKSGGDKGHKLKGADGGRGARARYTHHHGHGIGHAKSKNVESQNKTTPQNPKEETLSGNTAPWFYLTYGVPGGIYGTPNTLWFLYGDRHYQHYHTKFSNASGKFSLDEPNTFVQMQGRLHESSSEWSLFLMKQKIDPLGLYKIEAPTAIEFGLASNRRYHTRFDRLFNFSTDISLTAGATYGAPMYKDPITGEYSQDEINFNGVTFKGSQTERYARVGYSATIVARVNFTFLSYMTAFTALSYHHLQGTWINSSQGGQKLGYKGSASITVGVGFDIKGYRR
ncbi:MAG: hypothetical protein IT236_18965 [Bacteroidia bacterium]|nr:hypothetical protein [Bacteroidia bacterium]